MRETDGPRAATAAHLAAPEVAPRFTRAVKAERSRLEGKREQLLRKREAVQAELGRIDRAVGATDELLELLVPLLAANGSRARGGRWERHSRSGARRTHGGGRRHACARSRALSVRDASASEEKAQPAKE